MTGVGAVVVYKEHSEAVGTEEMRVGLRIITL